MFYQVRGELPTSREIAEKLFILARTVPDSTFLLIAHARMGEALLHVGEPLASLEHLEQGIALYDPQQHRSHALLSGGPSDASFRSLAAVNLWILGYPDPALKKTHEALALAPELSRSFGLCFTLSWAALLHLCRREGQLAQERAEAAMALALEGEFLFMLAAGTIFRGLALAEQGLEEEGITQVRQSLTASQATGAEVGRQWSLVMLAEAHGKVGQVEAGFQALDEATAIVRKTEQHNWEAELYRLRGELTLQEASQKAKDKSQKSKVETNPQSLTPNPQGEVEQEAEGYFQKAIVIARKQQAKSLELRATTSLARLWQQQGKQKEAHHMLSDIYGWFTEGFDTKDLQEAEVLIEELSH
jgi:predicted ATPase